MGIGAKSSFGRHKTPRNSHLPPPEQIKLQTEELHAIVAELSQIKAQVDHLLDSLELLDQQKDQLPGTEDIEESRHPGSKDSSCRTPEPQHKPRGQREADSSRESADPEEAGSWYGVPASLWSLGCLGQLVLEKLSRSLRHTGSEAHMRLQQRGPGCSAFLLSRPERKAVGSEATQGRSYPRGPSARPVLPSGTARLLWFPNSEKLSLLAVQFICPLSGAKTGQWAPDKEVGLVPHLAAVEVVSGCAALHMAKEG
ncbi:Rna-Binding Protein Raly [Manis pentadactyla]|nr:Rna-Binding Protein Raly [Manis pentadactyla]